MSGKVRDKRLDSRTARFRLARGRQPHWRTIVPGRAHLGFQRWKDAAEGRWLLRRYVNGKYTGETIGLADDAARADGDRILTFEQAEAKARAMVEAPATKIDRMTVRQAMELYVDYKRSLGQSVSDVIGRGTVHILPTLGNRVVAELTAEELRRWLASLAASRAQLRPKAGKVKHRPEAKGDEAIRARRASANRVLTMLKAILNHAYDEGHLPNRDAWGRKLKPFRDVERARLRFLTEPEATRLINAADGEFRSLVEAGLQTGARYGELIRLEACDFDAAAGTINIRRSKTGKGRYVWLTPEGVEFFTEMCAGRAGNDLIFRKADGEPWKKSSQARPMREACARAKIKPAIGFHQLRHTYASLAVMGGAPLLILARNLGHTDTRMCEKHYAHLAPSYEAEAIRAAAPRFNIKRERRLVPFR